MITISLVNTHEDDRKTIVTLLAQQDDFHLIGVGKDGYDALKSAKTQRPDIIIMDFSMRDIDSPDLAPIIKRNSPTTALVVLCSPDEQNPITAILKAGISGCLLKREDFVYLAACVRCVFYGGLYISKSMRSPALNNVFMPEKIFPLESAVSCHSFTLTELGIFYGISSGHTDREIAKDLNMRIGSVRNCVNQVKKKTGLHNRTQISIYALSTGIINIEKIKNTFL